MKKVHEVEKQKILNEECLILLRRVPIFKFVYSRGYEEHGRVAHLSTLRRGYTVCPRLR